MGRMRLPPEMTVHYMTHTSATERRATERGYPVPSVAESRGSGEKHPARPSGRSPYWRFFVPAGVFLVATAAYPLATLLRMAFGGVTLSNLGGGYGWVGLANFRSVIDEPNFYSSLRLTGYFTGALLAVDLILGYVVAEALRRPSRLATVTQSVLMVSWALPVLVTGTIWRFLLLNNGVLNTLLQPLGIGTILWLASAKVALWGVLIAVAWASLPFCATVIRGGMLSVPLDTLEAARVDGAGRWSLATKVVLPQMRSTIGTLAVLIITYGFGASFGFIDVMTAGGPGTATTTIPVLAYNDSFQTFQFGAGAALAVMAMAIVVVLAAFMFRLSRETWRASGR